MRSPRRPGKAAASCRRLRMSSPRSTAWRSTRARSVRPRSRSVDEWNQRRHFGAIAAIGVAEILAHELLLDPDFPYEGGGNQRQRNQAAPLALRQRGAEQGD